MLTRLLHTSQGILIGSVLTFAGCAWLYLGTHTIKFTATASNQPTAVVQAQAIEDLLPPRKPAH
jgi:hypothetical protein